ncbi:MAG: 30S ribosomal protein S16 [Chloroflexi bacterium RBG_13_57_8]|nr:MAG: 30S ribosomal protein S16 [Chloroflexi bacterium RBG_13_57_8]
MLRIRLRRMGARKHPSYRLVVADMRSPRDGAFVEIIGNYDPMTNPETVVIKEERALYWLKKGAQPSDTTARLLGKAGILEKFKPVKEKP